MVSSSSVTARSIGLVNVDGCTPIQIIGITSATATSFSRRPRSTSTLFAGFASGPKKTRRTAQSM